MPLNKSSAKRLHYLQARSDMNRRPFLIMLSTCLIAVAGHAQSPEHTYKCSTSPVSMLENMSNTLIKEYKTQEKKLKSDSDVKSYARKATTDALLPSLDAEYMAKQIVGRYHWNNAKSKDKKEFIEAYKSAIAAEYSKFLLKTSKKENYLKFYPSRQNSPTQTVVLATIKGRKKNNTIGFYMHCVDNTVIKDLPYKTWMIYDITLDNISYLDQFKVSVSSTVRNSGLAGLTKKIIELSNEHSKSKKRQK